MTCTLLLLAIAAEPANLAPAAQISTHPALDGQPAALVDGRPGAVAFVVGSEGPGTVTFTWDEPRTIVGVRLLQGSEIYRADAVVVEIALQDPEAFTTTVAEAGQVPVGEPLELRFDPVVARALRIRCTAGEAKGKRAYPCWAEIAVLGVPLPGDTAAAVRLGHPVAAITAAHEPRRRTPLVVAGHPPAILAGAAYAEVAAGLRERLAERLGVAPTIVATVAEAPLGDATVIALGNMTDNELLTRLYFNRYTYEDGLHPGPDGYTVHPVYDPYPWGGQDVIVLGVSAAERAAEAVERLLGLLEGSGAETALPYRWIVEPSRALTDAQREALAAKDPEPSFTAFRESAEAYLKSGEEAHARRAIRALEIMAGIYRAKPQRPVPWPEETTSGAILAAWDAFEEHPLITPAQRQEFVNAFFAFCRGLQPRVSDYAKCDVDPLVSWNHTTFPLLGLYFGGRYFDRYYHLPEAAEWLAKARACFTAQARSWKPQEDADSYLVLTVGHAIDYSLAEWDLRFFEAGLMERYADYVVGIGDQRQWPSGFGDSGWWMSPSLAGGVLPLAYWWTGDPQYLWILDRISGGAWPNPYRRPGVPTPAQRFVGLRVYPLDPQVYRYVQTRPSYNEPVEPCDVNEPAAFDKIVFRGGWDEREPYLVLDGLGRGKHLHYDTGSIIELVWGGERWLIDHDYLIRNTTEHTMLSVLRNGRCERLVPALAALGASAETTELAYSRTTVKDYNGVDWERRLAWIKGAGFVVQDTITAREPGDYDLELTWKTVDRGHQVVRGNTFEAVASPTASQALLTVDDPTASGGRAIVFGSPQSRLVFGVELPAGELQIDTIARGVDGSSDSLWVTIDGGPAVACHIPQGRYGSARAAFESGTPLPKLTLATAGPHAVVVTLRENPPVHLDRIVFLPANGEPVVVEADSAAPPPAAAEAQAARMTIAWPTPLQARVTNHVRQGITVPVSVLHQRRAQRLAAGETVRFLNVITVRGPQVAADRELAPTVDGFAVGGGPPLAGAFGEQSRGAGRVVAEVCLGDLAVGATAIALGDRSLSFQPAVNVRFDAEPERLTIEAAAETTVTPQGCQVAADGGAPGDGPIRLAPGSHRLTLSGLGPLPPPVAAVAPAAAPEAAPPAAGAAPSWATDLGAREPVAVLRYCPQLPAPLLAAAGPISSGLVPDGRVLWTHHAGGPVRDMSLARLTPDGPTTILVGSADTWLYRLGPDGTELGRHQPTGVYFSADHGERPWGVYQSRGVDLDGDGVDEIVTTLASMELQVLDARLNKRWGYFIVGHGCMDMQIVDLDGDGVVEILAGDKYGSVVALEPDGKRRFSSYTSIGDMAFDTGDLDGDGRREVVLGSSTGDLQAVDHTGKVLWRFDNYGYPNHRIRCADLDGDGRAEVLIGSGTAYVYCLAGDGAERWRRRLGFAVNDLAIIGQRVAAGDEDGVVTLLDGSGEPLWRGAAGAAVRKLATWEENGDTWLVSGTSDGRVLAWRLPD